jgi:hypothetical protein
VREGHSLLRILFTSTGPPRRIQLKGCIALHTPPRWDCSIKHQMIYMGTHAATTPTMTWHQNSRTNWHSTQWLDSPARKWPRCKHGCDSYKLSATFQLSSPSSIEHSALFMCKHPLDCLVPAVLSSSLTVAFTCNYLHA